MPTAVTLTDISNVDIDTTRSGNADGWYFRFDTIDDVTAFGYIYDNADTFIDDTTGTAAALKISVVQDTDTIAVQDFDFLTITGSGGNISSPLVVWLPALTGADTLYVDTDGNTWYDSALTQPAGGVLDESDSFTPADTILVATEILSDSFTPSDALDATAYIDVNVSESIIMNETFSSVLKVLNLYFRENVNMLDEVSLSEYLLTLYLKENLYVEDSLADALAVSFTEDTQSDFDWVEI